MKLKAFRAFGLAAIAALLLTSCGGGDSSPEFKRVVSFGDSLSDLGTYTPATSLTQTPGAPPFFGGRFTTNVYTGYTATSNTNIATIWVEYVAAKVGVPITQAEAGFGPVSVKCPVALTAPALAGSCTAYGQGGARMKDPNGIGHSSGALTVPLDTQVDNHLANPTFGKFSGSDLVLVFGGDNDILYWYGAVAQGAADQNTALAAIQQAATDLVSIVKDKIIANGGKYVGVIQALDFTPTPFGQAQPAAGKALLSALHGTFNQTVTDGLAGVGARIINSDLGFQDAVANPSKYGLTNVTATACDPQKIALITQGLVTDGSSLFCNASAGQPFNGLAAGASASTWLFADSVHPTTGGHKILADQIIARLKDFGWIAENL